MAKHGENKFHTGIEAVSKINAQNIDAANYFITLLAEAADAALVSETETAYMQSQISDILADLIWQYTAGASTSVKTEVAARLVKSVISALDCFCRITSGVLGSERCLEMLKEKAGIKSCYAKGLEYIAQAAGNTRA